MAGPKGWASWLRTRKVSKIESQWLTPLLALGGKRQEELEREPFNFSNNSMLQLCKEARCVPGDAEFKQCVRHTPGPTQPACAPLQRRAAQGAEHAGARPLGRRGDRGRGRPARPARRPAAHPQRRGAAAHQALPVSGRLRRQVGGGPGSWGSRLRERRALASLRPPGQAPPTQRTARPAGGCAGWRSWRRCLR